jgi:hypothetical protein
MMSSDEARTIMRQHGIKAVDIARLAEQLGDTRCQATILRAVARAFARRDGHIPWYAELILRMLTTTRYEGLN